MWGKRAQVKDTPQTVDESIFGNDLPFAAAEAYKRLRANILFALPDEQHCRVVGITSASKGEGKSTTSINLSYVLAEAGKRVLLLEADMRVPVISVRLKLKSTLGLSNVLAGQCNINDAMQPSNIHTGLYILNAGTIPPNPSELLGLKTMEDLLEVLSKDFDFIIMDLPPIGEVSDALVASKLTDGMIVVVRQNYAVRRLLAETMQQLQYVDAKVLGFVMTWSDTQMRRINKYKKDYYNNYSE